MILVADDMAGCVSGGGGFEAILVMLLYLGFDGL